MTVVSRVNICVLCQVGEGLGSQTRSSAQGNCSAKSLAGNVVDSSLSSPSHAVHRGGLGVGVSGGRGFRWGRGVGEGEGG